MANYGLTFVVDAPYLLEEGVDVTDFPVIVKIPIANTSNLYGTGETADTIYFESEGVQLKHELMEITATYCTAWVKMDLEADSKKVVTLHYGALVDNNYEDKRGVWVNAQSVWHFNGDLTDSMGISTTTPSATVYYDTFYGVNYKGCYFPNAVYATLTQELSFTLPYSFILIASNTAETGFFGGSMQYVLVGINSSNGIIWDANTSTGAFANVVDCLSPKNVPMVYYGEKTTTGNSQKVIVNGVNQVVTFFATSLDVFSVKYLGGKTTGTPDTGNINYSELMLFNDAKSQYWVNAFYRHYMNPDAYIEYGTEVDLDALTALDIDEADCVANVSKQLGIYDVDFRNIMYEVGDYNATWRLPGTEGITIWGIYQPRPVGDYYFPEMDNLGINDALFFTVTDYLVDIHDKIDIEGVRFDLQAIQVHPIADQKIYKMCVLKRQPEYYATAKGVVS